MPIAKLNIPAPGSSQSKKKIFRKKRFYFAVFLFFAIILSVFSLIGLGQIQTVKAKGEKVGQRVNLLKAAAKKEDLVELRHQNELLKVDLLSFQKDIFHYKILDLVPVASSYYDDANHLVKAGLIATNTLNKTLDALGPLSDVLGLGSKTSQTNAEQKAQIVVREVIPKIIPQLDSIHKDLREIETEIDQINPSRYPSVFKVGGFQVGQLISEAQQGLKKANTFLPELKPILNKLPNILGEPSEKNYLIIFQNDKELRPSGGFITSYALAKVRNGRLISIFSEDIYKLEDRPYFRDEPIYFLKQFLAQKLWGIRDTNVFADFRTSAQYFEEVYHRIPGTEKKIDGIIGIDTEFVRGLLSITGPVKLNSLNETFSSDINELGLPDVTYKLELHAEKKQTGEDRKGFIGDLMNEIITKVSAFPPEKFQPFLEGVYNSTEQKHILFYFKDEKTQDLAERYNLAGRIKNYSGDYLYVNNANFGGLKGNLYVKFNINQDITIASDGTITKKITTQISNPAKADKWLNFLYQNWQRILVPQGSSLVSQKVPKDFGQSSEGGKQVFSSYSQTQPLKTTQAIYTYTLPFKLQKGEAYRLLMQKQPGDSATTVTIKINGEIKKSFELTKDEEFSFDTNLR